MLARSCAAEEAAAVMDMDHAGAAIAAIGDVPSFADMDEASLEAIVAAAVERSYAPGEVVCRDGEPAAGLFAVQRGWLKAYKVSEIGAYAGAANQATVEALESTSLWIISHETLIRLMQLHPEIIHLVTRNLAQRVIHLMGLVEDLSLRTVTQRLVRMLLDHSSGEVLSRRRWSTQAEMAARLGTVPDVLNRALRELVDEGLIEMERQALRILDRPGLETKARNSE